MREIQKTNMELLDIFSLFIIEITTAWFSNH